VIERRTPNDLIGGEVNDVKVSRGQGRDALAPRGQWGLHLGICIS
jgi:hypothetical protein